MWYLARVEPTSICVKRQKITVILHSVINEHNILFLYMKYFIDKTQKNAIS